MSYHVRSQYSQNYISKQNASFADALEVLIETFCRSHEALERQAVHSGPTHEDLVAHTEKILTALTTNNPEVHVKDFADRLQSSLSSKIDEKLNMATLVTTSIKRQDDSLARQLDTIQRHQENMGVQMQNIVQTRQTNRYRGDEGEQGMAELLEGVLRSRDGYELHETKSIPHSCDFLVTRTGHPDVRIEVKNHSGSVRAAEVKRFEKDIMGLNDHGIFISLKSKIVGKDSLQVDLLSNNKVAIYVSKNEYDVEAVKGLVELIYRIHEITASREGRVITKSTLTSISMHLSTFKEKIDQLKSHLKNGMDILNTMTTGTIERLLLSGGDEVGESAPAPSLECESCKKTFERPCALAMHKKTCVK